jgi:thioredoxin 1
VAAVVVIVAARAGRPPAPAPASAPHAARVPRLVDVGAGRCIPCKEMAPILEELRVEYAGRMDVQFIDVWQNPRAGEPYGIRMIPTQIFFGADGRELARHEGFMAKADILARWKALGVEL